MAVLVRTGAPGKVILCGEHAVVHGKTAVAMSLGLRTYVSISEGTTEGFVLDLPDVGLSTTITLKELESLRGGPIDVLDTPPSLTPEIRSALSVLDPSPAASQAKAAFIYLAAHILPDHPSARSLRIHAKSMLPIGAGLGSSASFSTALAGALLLLRSSLLHDLVGEISPMHVNAWAFRAEQLIHGNPSGVDNQVSSYGGALAFQSGHVTNLTHVRSMDFLLTNTRVPRSTKDLVAGVGQRLLKHPAPMNNILDAMQSISDSVLQILEEIADAADDSVSSQVDRLQTLMAMNHHLLNSIGVGHPALDAVCATTLAHGLQSKLTGAGGGGCAITLLRPGANADQVQSALQALGFECFRADVGVPGIKAYDTQQGAENEPLTWTVLRNSL